MGIEHSLEEALLRAIHHHDRVGAVTLALGALDDNTVAIPDLYEMLAGVLVDTGADWQSGTLEVWQEHLATGIVRNIVEAAASRVEREAPAVRGGTVLLAAPDDEYHDLGLRMLADRFALAGWRAHFLGASLPVGQAVAAVRELQADAVALSAATHFHRLVLRTYVARLEEAHPELRIWVGGAAFAHDRGGWPAEIVLGAGPVPSPGDV